MLLWLWSSRRIASFRQVARRGRVVGMSRWEATDARAGLTKYLVLRFPLAESCNSSRRPFPLASYRSPSSNCSVVGPQDDRHWVNQILRRRFSKFSKLENVLHLKSFGVFPPVSFFFSVFAYSCKGVLVLLYRWIDVTKNRGTTTYHSCRCCCCRYVSDDVLTFGSFS